LHEIKKCCIIKIRIVVIKMKKVLKIVLLLVIMLSIQFQMSISYAERPSVMVDPEGTSAGGKGGTSENTETIIDTDVYNPNNYSIGSTTELEQKAGIIVAVIRNVGIVVAVIALMIIGIKTVVASSEEKSVYKQALPGYLLGAFMVVAITAIPSLIYSFMK
jgi:hypothetical protein